MAWQLIYTSAPRLLEAGRSGFGSVARHRAIPPLLVAAVERISQFSRLPGLDTERVIYSYRIITAGGGRFHVLSCIRDAGADYTGRTNHLAHHLVAEPREIAALGASPADVLLAMPWCETWTELPRWLEPSEEFALSSVAPQTNADGAWWSSVTGNAAHAWLLARGEASRSANLLTPLGCDLRPLYAESLRLTPERLWQMPFTTALQPSDDPADFRWLGLEASSQGAVALPSQRPTLDLSAPETLPVPEVPTTPVPVPAAPGRSGKPVAASAPRPRAVAAPRVVAASKAVPPAPRPVPAEKPFSSQPSAPGPRWPWLAAAAAMVLVACGALVFHRQGQQIKTERDLTLALIDRLRPLEPPQEARLREEIAKLTTRAQLQSSRDLLNAATSDQGPATTSADSGLQDLRTVLRQIAEARATRDATQLARKTASTTPTPKRIASTPVPKIEAATPKPKPAEMTTVYFVENKESLPNLMIPDLRPELNFELRVAGEAVRLGFKSGSIIRRNAQSTNGGFQINGQTLRAEPGTPVLPFLLAARAENGTDLFRLYVGVPEQTSPLFAEAKARLTADGDGWKITGDFPKPVLEPGATLQLVGAKPLGPEGQPLQLACDAQLRCSLDPAIATLRALIRTRQKEASDLGKHAAEAEGGANSIESLRKAVQNDMQILKSDEARKGLNFTANSGSILVGEFGMALVTEWRTSVGEKGDQQRSEALEKIYQQSKKLAETSNNSERAKSEMLNLRRVISSSDKSLRTNPFGDGLSRLRLLNEKLAILLGETGGLDQAVAKYRELAELKEREAKALESSPLLSGNIPPDHYTLVIRFGSGRVVKLISVPEPAAP